MKFKVGDKVVLNAAAVREGIYKVRTDNMPVFNEVVIGQVVGHHTNPRPNSDPISSQWVVSEDILVVSWLVRGVVEFVWCTEIHQRWVKHA